MRAVGTGGGQGGGDQWDVVAHCSHTCKRSLVSEVVETFRLQKPIVGFNKSVTDGFLWNVCTLEGGGGAKLLLEIAEIVLVLVSLVLEMCMATKSRGIKINYVLLPLLPRTGVPLLLRLPS